MSEHGQEPFRHPAVFYRGMVAVPTDNGAVLRAALGQHSEWVRWIDMTVAGSNPGWIIPVCCARSPTSTRSAGCGSSGNRSGPRAAPRIIPRACNTKR